MLQAHTKGQYILHSQLFSWIYRLVYFRTKWRAVIQVKRDYWLWQNHFRSSLKSSGSTPWSSWWGSYRGTEQPPLSLKPVPCSSLSGFFLRGPNNFQHFQALKLNGPICASIWTGHTSRAATWICLTQYMPWVGTARFPSPRGAWQELAWGKQKALIWNVTAASSKRP